MRRAARTVMLAALISGGPSCATVYAPALVPGQVAQVKIVAPPDPIVDFDGYRPRKTIDIAVHDFANGCPLVESTRTGKGYKGRIKATFAATTNVAVPAGRRLTFTSEWALVEARAALVFIVGMPGVLATSCTSVVSFVPVPGRTYVVKFPDAPDLGKPACGATAEIEGAPQNGSGPPERIAYPHVLRGSDAFQPGGLCALGAN